MSPCDKPLILVLEDEAVVAMELETRLLALGYRVSGPVSTVSAAILLAERERPDLLLADVRLEGVPDGIAAASALRSQLGVPVVYLTAHTDAVTLSRAMATEPFGYLTKPLRESELHATITTALHRDRLERKLAERERQLEEAQRLGRLGSWEWELDTDRATWSKPLLELMDLDAGAPRQAAFSSFLAIVHEDDRASIRASVHRALENTGPLEHEYRIVRKDGSVRAIEARTEVDRDRSGKPVRMRGVSRDVTEARAVSRALATSEARFRAVFEGVSDGLLVIDPRGRIKLVNATAETLFGYARGELLDQEVDALVPLGARAAHAQRRAEFAAESRARIMATGRFVRGRRKDGSEVALEIGLSQAPFDGETCVVVAARDITDKLCAERELTQTRERLAQTQRLEAIGRLAGGVAHDFNNLLTVILGMSRVLRSMLVDKPQGLSLLSDIDEASRRGADLVERLLSFARRKPVRAGAVDVNMEIHAFAHLLARIVGPNIEVVTELCPHAGRVWIDPSQVEQLLLNLAVNARDAMPEGGHLWLRTRTQHRPGDQAHRLWLVLEVADDGCGMSDDVSPRIFEPFFTTKAFGDGSGLGLSIVYGIVTQAGGEVAVRSAPGEGSTFDIWLPIHTEVDTPREDMTIQDMRGAKSYAEAVGSMAIEEERRG